MKTRLLSLCLIFISVISFTTTSVADLPPAVNGHPLPTLAPMLQKVLPGVVNISIIGEIQTPAALSGEAEQAGQGQSQGNHRNQDNLPIRPFPQIRKFESLGSGVIADTKNGYIITNAHLLRNAKTVSVTLSDGRQRRAKLIGMDPPSDIAVIQIQAEDLVAMPAAKSEELQVGDFVVAIGNPFGLHESVTSGIVSALQRTGLGIEGYENFIQTDAPINPGNSGGALVNLKGELVGINTAILAPSGGNVGIGFAIPIDMAKSVMSQLVQYGSVKRGLIGVMIQTLTPGLADAFNQPTTKGAIVTQVNPNSPAEKAGFKPGDIIQKVNDRTISTAGQVTNLIGLLRVGSNVNVTALRNGKPIQLSMATTAPQAYQKLNLEANPFLFGIDLHNFYRVIAGFGLVEGVQVLDIDEDSPAWRATPVGVRQGDVIVSANQIPVRTLDELKAAVKKNSNQLILNVLREGGAVFVVIK